MGGIVGGLAQLQRLKQPLLPPCMDPFSLQHTTAAPWGCSAGGDQESRHGDPGEQGQWLQPAVGLAPRQGRHHCPGTSGASAPPLPSSGPGLMMVITCCHAPAAAPREGDGSCPAGRERQPQDDTKHGDASAPGVPWGEAKLQLSISPRQQHPPTPPLASVIPTLFSIPFNRCREMSKAPACRLSSLLFFKAENVPSSVLAGSELVSSCPERPQSSTRCPQPAGQARALAPPPAPLPQHSYFQPLAPRVWEPQPRPCWGPGEPGRQQDRAQGRGAGLLLCREKAGDQTRSEPPSCPPAAAPSGTARAFGSVGARSGAVAWPCLAHLASLSSG